MIYHKFSHGTVSYMLNGENVNFILGLKIIEFIVTGCQQPHWLTLVVTYFSLRFKVLSCKATLPLSFLCLHSQKGQLLKERFASLCTNFEQTLYFYPTALKSTKGLRVEPPFGKALPF